jgi:hypothetical protein
VEECKSVGGGVSLGASGRAVEGSVDGGEKISVVAGVFGGRSVVVCGGISTVLRMSGDCVAGRSIISGAVRDTLTRGLGFDKSFGSSWLGFLGFCFSSAGIDLVVAF